MITEAFKGADLDKVIARQIANIEHEAKFGVRIHADYHTVFKGNAGKIGVLQGDIPKEVAKFYVLYPSIAHDMNMLDQETYKVLAPDASRAGLPRSAILAWLKNSRKELEDLYEVAERLATLLDREKGRYLISFKSFTEVYRLKRDARGRSSASESRDHALQSAAQEAATTAGNPIRSAGPMMMKPPNETGPANGTVSLSPVSSATSGLSSESGQKMATPTTVSMIRLMVAAV